MAAKAFYAAAAQREVARVIEEIEAETAAEIVVAVRPASASYRHVDFFFGFLASFVALIVFLYHPTPIRLDLFAIEFPLVFASGTLLSAAIPGLKRLLTLAPTRHEAVTCRARATFVELGIGRTRARTGLLVYVSLFERRVVLVPDIGVDLARLGKSGRVAIERLESALGGGADLERFVGALRALAEPLRKTLPRALDDQNELPDTMSVS